MLRVHQIFLALDAAEHLDEEMLRTLAAGALGISRSRVKKVRLQKRSLDARDQVHFTLTADVLLQGGEAAERSVAGKFKPNQVVFAHLL